MTQPVNVFQNLHKQQREGFLADSDVQISFRAWFWTQQGDGLLSVLPCSRTPTVSGVACVQSLASQERSGQECLTIY